MQHLYLVDVDDDDEEEEDDDDGGGGYGGDVGDDDDLFICLPFSFRTLSLK
jgi:hypothetical protein